MWSERQQWERALADGNLLVPFRICLLHWRHSCDVTAVTTRVMGLPDGKRGDDRWLTEYHKEGPQYTDLPIKNVWQGKMAKRRGGGNHRKNITLISIKCPPWKENNGVLVKTLEDSWDLNEDFQRAINMWNPLNPLSVCPVVGCPEETVGHWVRKDAGLDGWLVRSSRALIMIVSF